jgi:hypothetical protein
MMSAMNWKSEIHSLLVYLVIVTVGMELAWQTSGRGIESACGASPSWCKGLKTRTRLSLEFVFLHRVLGIGRLVPDVIVSMAAIMREGRLKSACFLGSWGAEKSIGHVVAQLL